MIEKASYVIMSLTAIVLAGHVLFGDDLRQGQESPAIALEVGTPAPGFTLATSDADSIAALHQDRSTLLVFFSTACVYCRASLPIYREIASKKCDTGITFVVVDRRGTDLDEWWAENAWSDDFEPCATVQIGSPASSIAGYGINGTPTHVLVDGSGIIRRAEDGALMSVPTWLDQAV